MIVPQYWAEARLQHRDAKRRITVRRFGWSDTSQADAQARADARTNEALQRILSGERLERRDLKVAYNGAEGIPIREEIVERHGPTVITRNSYGALCLNTPNVFFADIDFEEKTASYGVVIFVVLLAIALIVSRSAHSPLLFGLLFVVAWVLSSLIGSALRRRAAKPAREKAERAARSRLDAFMAQHPDWNVRLYKTPAGLRLLALHQIFNPNEPAVAEAFEALRVDRTYRYMCLNQHCFRARLTAKPWRIGIASHLRPRPGVWPIAPERLPERQAWLAEYDAAAKTHAACTFIEHLGSSTVHPDAVAVQKLHDDLSAATRQLPIA